MNCFNCQHFELWDGDPCCLSPKGWKLILPCTIDCTEFEDKNPKLPNLEKAWNNIKKEFFDKYIIKPELAKRYLQLYPEDKDLINVENGK